MSVLEWMFEAGNPGPVGQIGVNPLPEDDDEEERPKRWWVWLAIVLGLILSGCYLYWAFHDHDFRALRLYGLAFYLLLSYFITSSPDYSNVGWLGGLLDNPFRISDDYNRWLAFFQVVLFPGKLIIYSWRMSWLIGKRYWQGRRIR